MDILVKPSFESKSDPRSKAKLPLDKRKLLGQVFTPDKIASEMAANLIENRPKQPITILDPCVGEYSFINALANTGKITKNDKTIVMDIDEEMINKVPKWSKKTKITLERINSDYLSTTFTNKFDYIIQNPPYVRQEWIENKINYQKDFLDRYGVKIPGTSNYYVYFIVKMIQDLRPGGKFSVIIYDSWQSTKYGEWLADYIYTNCRNIKIKNLHNQPFEGRLIDATIIYGEKNEDSQKISNYIKNKDQSSIFSKIGRFVKLDDLFETKRGLRLKQADFFLTDKSDIKKLGAIGFIKKVSKVKGYSVNGHHDEAALLISYNEVNNRIFHEISKRLEKAKNDPVSNATILNWYKERPNTWFYHREKPIAPIIFNYYLRNRPKHIYNPNNLVFSDNFYGLFPRSSLSIPAYVAILNSTAVSIEVLSKSRNQGNGLAKIQLYKYRHIYIPDISNCLDSEIKAFNKLGLKLIEGVVSSEKIIYDIDKLIYLVFKDKLLKPEILEKLYDEANLKARKPKEN